MSEQPRMPSPAGGGVQFNGPTLVSILYLATYFTGVSAIVGLVLAYVWKGQPSNEWERSHYSYLVRTFWLAVGGYVACVLAMVVGATGAISAGDAEPPVAVATATLVALAVAGGAAVIALTVMLLVRCVMSLVNAQQCLPMPKPQSWTI